MTVKKLLIRPCIELLCRLFSRSYVQRGNAVCDILASRDAGASQIWVPTKTYANMSCKNPNRTSISSITPTAIRANPRILEY